VRADERRITEEDRVLYETSTAGGKTETSDLEFAAAALTVTGHEPSLSKSPDSPGMVVFAFAADLSALRKKFLADEVLVSPRRFIHNYRSLRRAADLLLSRGGANGARR
jgi:hypothetical protein